MGNASTTTRPRHPASEDQHRERRYYVLLLATHSPRLRREGESPTSSNRVCTLIFAATEHTKTLSLFTVTTSTRPSICAFHCSQRLCLLLRACMPRLPGTADASSYAARQLPKCLRRARPTLSPTYYGEGRASYPHHHRQKMGTTPSPCGQGRLQLGTGFYWACRVICVRWHYCSVP
jgi:hypothetical protein